MRSAHAFKLPVFVWLHLFLASGACEAGWKDGVDQSSWGHANHAVLLAQSQTRATPWRATTTVAPAPVIVEGTGRFVSPENQSAPQPAIKLDGPSVQLNFVNTEIKEFVRAILVDILRVDYVIDPKLEGSVTVRTTRSIPQDQAFTILSEVLRMNGATLTRKGALVRISRAAQRGDGLQVDLGNTARVVPLNFVGATQAAQSLTAFAGPSVRVQPNEDGRYLLLFGSSDDLDKLETIINVFDVDQMKGLSFGLFQLLHANPEAVAVELANIFEKAIQSDPKSIRFVALLRMSGLLVVTTQSSYLDETKKWISRLDQAKANDQRIYVYSVQNRRAEELASVLLSLFGNNAKGQEASRRIVAPGFQEQAYRAPSADLTSQLGNPSRQANHSPATRSGEPSPSNRGISITADKATNSLLINATPQEYSAIRSALLRIDTVPLQVLIEATIAEVSLNNDLRYGVRWFFEKGRGQASLTDSAAGQFAETFPGFNYFLNAPKLTVVVSALEEVTDVEIVSSPSLTVLDNETAELVVGDQVPIATRSSVGVQDPNSPVVNDIEFRDTGIILSVTPRVNSSGLVVLDISQEVSDVVATTTSTIDSPTISQRKIKSSVAVRDGTAIILGGLMSKKRFNSKAGLPLLRRIPKLGSLFGNADRNREKTELLVIIRPKVIRNQGDADAIAREMAEKFNGIFSIRAAPEQSYKR